MRNFKKIILASLILVMFELVLTFLLQPVSYSHFLNIDLKRMEENGQKPELLFVGDSRVYRTFIPSIFEDGMEELNNAVNIGTGSQSIKGSYFYLKDMIERYHPKYVIVGIDHIWFMNESEYITQGELTVIDRIKSPMIRLESIYNLLEKKDYPFLLRSYRARDGVDNIIQNVKDKLNPEIRKGIDLREDEYYADKGFVYTKSGFKDGNIGLPQIPLIQWEDSEKNQESFEYLDKIVALCNQNNIQLFLVTGPTSLATIYSIENYENFVNCFKTYAHEKGTTYQDMNLIKGRNEILPDRTMYDSDHVNGKGAEIISRIYCDILKKNIEGTDVSNYFYSSVEEMKRDIPCVVACDFYTEQLENGDYNIIASGLCPQDEVTEYEFLISKDEGESWQILQKYGEKNECRIKEEYLKEEILLRVNSRIKGSNSPYEAYEEKKKSIYLK